MTEVKQLATLELILGGEPRTLRLSFKAIAEIEARTGKGLLRLLSNMGNHDWRIGDLAVVVHALLGSPSKPSSDEIGDFIVDAGAANILAPLTLFLVGALSGGGETEPGEAKAAKR